MVAVSLLLIALSTPLVQINKDIAGDPTITLVIDKSASMQLFDLAFIDSFVGKLRTKIPVEVKEMNFESESPIGDFIFSNLKPDSNILVISDGQATTGTNIPQLSKVAVSINSTISVVDIQQKLEDVAVSIQGPQKTVADIENVYTVHLSKATKEDKAVPLKIVIDAETVFDQQTKEEDILIKRTFKEGAHTIIAEIKSEDNFPLNNFFQKTTKVIDKPNVLLVTQVPTQLKQLLDPLYDLDEKRAIPRDLSSYYAMVVYDMPREEVNNLEALQKFVIEGNGALFIGGYHSFDRSSYKGSTIEQILPVTVGSYEKKRGDATIAFAIDISGSSGTKYLYVKGSNRLEKIESKALSIQKALAIESLKSINEGNRVGVIAFTDQAYAVAAVEPLTKNKDDLIDKISRLKGEGQSDFAVGLGGAYELIKGMPGEKNILLISDGKTGSITIKQNTLSLAKALYDIGVHIYVIGVGDDPDVQFLSSIAQVSNGVYFSADQTNRLSLLFGEPEGKEVDQTMFDLFVLNKFHFITSGITLDTTMTAFNQVNAKRSAQTLVTLGTGEPALTVWRYGLGRVGALTAFAGENNLGDLLKDPNSRLLVRSVNWLIADPERKEEYFIDIPDSRVDTPTLITVKTDKIPQAPGLVFEKTDERTYVSEFVPKHTGMQTLLKQPFAVNYALEFQEMGMSEDLIKTARETGGDLFNQNEIDQIVKAAQSAAKKHINEEMPLRWPFILIALLLLLMDMIIRRVLDNWVKL